MKRIGFPTAFALCLFFVGACNSGNKADTNPPGEGCPEQGAQKKADDGCNTCICTVDGWSCSEMGCEDPAAAEEGGEEQPVDAEAEAGATDRATAEACTAGETKMEDCNECACGEDGVWTCTTMACDTEESPKT